jgi:hypothetical protein
VAALTYVLIHGAGGDASFTAALGRPRELAALLNKYAAELA